MAKFAVFLIVLGVIGVCLFAWADGQWTAPGPAAPSGNETVVLIAPHTRVHNIAEILERKGVVTPALLFEFNLRARQLAQTVKAGEYAIPSHASMADIAAILVAGKSIQHKITVAEGLTSDMIWKLVAHDTALTGDAGPVPAEGSLLPETYLFTRGDDRAALIAKMVRAQEKFLSQQWSSRAQGLPFQSMREAVILASIVEKETALPEERRHIAGVFLNRLRVGMKLQTDPTIIYGLTQGYPLGHGIRQSELESATPYNTYVIAGLPPGPICNPGKDSIAAVLNPETSDDLFFVANGKGGHVFSATISEHARNVAAFRARERIQASDRLDDTSTVPLPDTALPALSVPAPVVHRKKRRAHR
jgi:UPF0755 protein